MLQTFYNAATTFTFVAYIAICTPKAFMTCFVKNVAFWLARIPNFTVRITGTSYMTFSTSLRAETVDGV